MDIFFTLSEVSCRKLSINESPERVIAWRRRFASSANWTRDSNGAGSADYSKPNDRQWENKPMPDRIIRDELLTSERYWSVGIEAQRLFVHLLLNADALGRFSGKNYTIRAACYPGHAIDPKLVEKLLSDLQDADLVRIYQNEGERYLFIPRYRQRLKAKASYYPSPPREINDIPEEKADPSPPQGRLEAAEGREGREGKGIEEKEVLLASRDESRSANESVNGVKIPLSNRTEWGVPSAFLAELELAYPAVDGPATLREIRAWCVANPMRCKTDRGVKKFLNTWFAKEQDKHGG